MRVRTMTSAYVSAAVSPDLLNASMALAFSARFASIASFRSISFTFMVPTVQVALTYHRQSHLSRFFCLSVPKQSQVFPPTPKLKAVNKRYGPVAAPISYRAIFLCYELVNLP